jgi:hypothetical protein
MAKRHRGDRRKARPQGVEADYWVDYCGARMFVVGYTPGGAPMGGLKKPTGAGSIRTTITLSPKKNSSIRRSDLSTAKLATDLRAGRTPLNHPVRAATQFVRGGEGTRTLGLRLAKPPLFQLSYTPEPRTALGIGNRRPKTTRRTVMLGPQSDGP